MPETFTLYEDAWFRNGPVYASGPAVGYRVSGLPNGKTARIANFGAPPDRNNWRIMWINADNSQGEWTGHYTSVEEALAALQHASQ